jgi:hypothetical protein
MSDAVFRRESAVEYFKELVDGALSRQGLATQELTAYYVVQLLASFLQRNVAAPEDGETPLAVRLGRALESAGADQRARFRQSGDASLFVAGFFAESLGRKLVDVDYYISIGGCAYNALSRVETDAFSTVFAELGEKFVGFVDVLTEISERTSCTSNTDLLRLYEKWLRTGSRRSGQLLVERGVVPNMSIKTTRIQ